MVDFSDRFLLADPGFANLDLANLTQAQAEQQAPALAQYAKMVRAYSVLIRNKSLLEIYEICTQQSDPRIGLMLAASRDNSGNQIFPDLQMVKEFMFGKAPDTFAISPNADVTFQDRKVFIDGIRRVSASMTASILIGQLAQVPEQAKHALELEKQSIYDVQKIVQVPSVLDLKRAEELRPKTERASIYFEPKKVEIGSRTLLVSMYLSTELGFGWRDVQTYTGSIDTAQIVADIADYINTSSLSNNESNLLASPNLAGYNNLHMIELDARSRAITSAVELVTIRFSFTDADSNTLTLPFNWGIEPTAIKDYPLNSTLVTTQQGRVISTPIAKAQADIGVLNVLYFRRRTQDDAGIDIDLATAGVQNLTFRISPNMTDSISASVPLLVGQEDDRPNQVATLLLNELFAIKADTKALGALTHNDPHTDNSYYAGLQLVAWSRETIEAELILDLLEIPIDIEVAVGSVLAPVTKFSSKPRSIKVPAIFDNDAWNANRLDNLTSDGLNIIKSGKSKTLQKLNDIRQVDYIDYWDRKSLPAPPYPYHQRPSHRYPYYNPRQQ